MFLTLWLIACAPSVQQAPVEPTAAQPAPEPAKKGLNDVFLDPELDVQSFVTRFEGESREVVDRQPAVLAALDLQPGQAVADIGAGTGLYVGPFAEAVGAEGTVYAVDISPRFLDHLRTRSQELGLTQVQVVEGTEQSVELPPDSIDVAFICDTYHHFSDPPATLASLHSALRPGGRLYVLDFERIEGVSKDWTLTHVRAGKEVFAAEIEAAGFTPAGELEAGLEDNYLLAFDRP